MDIGKLINKKMDEMVYKMLTEQKAFTQTQAQINDTFTINDLNKLIDSLKPKKIVVTSNLELYKELLLLPFMNEDNVKFSKYIEGVLIVDMEEINKIPPYLPYF